MPRQFAPALRGLFVPRTTAPPPPIETKDFLTGGAGGVYTSMSYAGVTNVWGTPGRADGWDMERVVVEGYERSIWTFKSIEAISKHASTLPVTIGRGGDERRFEETLDDHPLLRLLNKRANPLETGDVFKKRLSAQLLLSKKGVFIEKTKSRGGTIVRLDLLPPDRVQIIPDDQNAEYVKHFEFTTYGGQIRELDPERVIWLRDPHPTDPFCGVTPLEAAGLSIDLDVKARTYNISFIDRDARPGGIIGIDLEGVDPREVERIQRRLSPGAHNAGELALVGTGPGGMNYVDTSARPREMAYETLSSTSKGEILAAFGVPESIVGNASERTYANADREEWTFWDHTELPHLNLIASGFDSDLSDDWTVRYDTSRVQALEFPRRQARDEARQEFEAGLITIDEYREIAGKRVFNVPQSRALWISPQKAPVPANPQDAAALGLGPDPAAGALPGADPNAGLPAQGGDESAVAAVAEARALAPGGSAADDVAAARAGGPLALPAGTSNSAAGAVAEARSDIADVAAPGPAAADVAAARDSTGEQEPGQATEDLAAVRAQLETKALPDEGFEVTDADFDALAMTIAAALTALLARQEGVIVARLRAPKTRKHTRYWEPENEHDTRTGDADIDQDRVVSAARWAEETTATLAPVLQRAATVIARKLGQSLTGTDSVPPAAVAAALVTAAYAGEAVTTLLGELAEVLQSTQAGGAHLGLEDLVDTVGGFYSSTMPALVARVAETCAVSTINGAADAAAESAGPGVVRTWITRQDDRVRPAHKALQGKTLPVGTPYQINGAQLRYPGDPFAPISLTVNCRCRLHYDTDPKE